MASTILDYATLVQSYGKDRVEKQIALEEKMAGLGTQEFHKQIESARQHGRESGTVYGQHLLAASIIKVGEGIREFLTAVDEGKSGRRHIAARYLRDAEPEVIAMITLRGVLDGVSSRRTLQSVAMDIAAGLHNEARARALAEGSDRIFLRSYIFCSGLHYRELFAN